MTTAESSTDRRCRGRPQLRSDDETRRIIYEAARHEFVGNGFAATSMETVARRAGVSTKTLYRLIPNKAALFEGMVSDRMDRFVFEVNLRAADHAEIEQALVAALIACAELALDEEIIALQRMLLQEAGKFSDIAAMFYKNAIQRSGAPRCSAACRCRRARRSKRGRAPARPYSCGVARSGQFGSAEADHALLHSGQCLTIRNRESAFS